MNLKNRRSHIAWGEMYIEQTERERESKVYFYLKLDKYKILPIFFLRKLRECFVRGWKCYASLMF